MGREGAGWVWRSTVAIMHGQIPEESELMRTAGWRRHSSPPAPGAPHTAAPHPGCADPSPLPASSLPAWPRRKRAASYRELQERQQRQEKLGGLAQQMAYDKQVGGLAPCPAS